MKPHRFDPLSFVAGAVLVIYAAVLLFGHVRLHELRPSVLWIWPVLAFGALLTLYGARRLWESRESEPPTEDEATEEI
ncbi:MAG TPA: hypothetical protein VF968_07750 [Actinomycetota bacterium]